MIIEIIYPLFIFTGIVIICVLIYIRRLTANAISTLPELIELNASLNFDLHKFLPQSMTLLKKIKMNDIFYDISFINTRLEKAIKNRDHRIVKKRIERPDYSITIGILPRSSKGEMYYLNLIALEILFMLIEMDVLITIKVANESLYRFSRLQTFILHDVKNLAQFISTMSYNIAHMDSHDRRERFIDYLKESLPSLSRRAGKIISMLETKTLSASEGGEKSVIDVRTLVERLAKYYKINCHISGKAPLLAEEEKAGSIFDNLLKNVYDKSVVEPDILCNVEIKEDEDNVSVIVSDNGSRIENPQRIFEPFYSSRKEGLGIGLYHTKYLLDSMGGKIELSNEPGCVSFKVSFPKQPM